MSWSFVCWFTRGKNRQGKAWNVSYAVFRLSCGDCVPTTPLTILVFATEFGLLLHLMTDKGPYQHMLM